MVAPGSKEEKSGSVFEVAPLTHPSPETGGLSLTFLFLFTAVTLPFLPLLWESILFEVQRCHTVVCEEVKGLVHFEGPQGCFYKQHETGPSPQHLNLTVNISSFTK